MNININNNITIEHDSKTLLKIKELIEIGFKKLKHYINSKKSKNKNMNFYYDLKERFNKIYIELKELKLCNELRYLLSISQFIDYIVYQNSINDSFGHCEFALELLDFCIEIFKTNFDYYLNSNNMSFEEFELFQEEIKRKHREYRREFYNKVYEKSGNYADNELYEIHESLREL